MGNVQTSVCPNCKSSDGRKLDLETLSELAHQFFVRGSLGRTEYGAASVIQFNEYRHGEGDVAFPRWLADDARLIEDTLKVGFFYYGPPLWRVGEIEPLRALQHRGRRGKVIQSIIAKFPTRELPETETFYRLRRNPLQPGEPSEYDAAPDAVLGQGRLDTSGLPVLYGSQDLDICVHECRVTVADELHVAVLRPTRALRLLDLSGSIEEDFDVTPFESLGIAVRMLFHAESHSYEISQAIATAARDANFDGLAYPSYFSQVREGVIANVAIFGRPVSENLVRIECINRLKLERVSYVTQFGPTGY